MSLGSRLTLVVTCLTLVPGPCRAQNDCFTSSSIVGAVLGTFFSTAVALALLVFFLWWIYYRRTPNGADRQTKGPRMVESGSGFDNPCFEANPNSDVVDGGKAEEYGQKDARSTSWTPLRFFGANKNEKKRSMDDSFVSEPERVSVQLRGRDFTGLGLNVTGNMRDGIFIKDISNRGPAFESGKIAPGDRILNVTISFRNVVFEDAMTILSYASPYDVTLELEKGLRNNSSTLKKRKASSTVSLASASANVTLLTGTGSAQPEGPPNERLVHPLYRSQSIDDLSKVGRADNTVRAEVRIPSLSGHLSGGLAKSKLLGKANIELDAPNVPDVKIKGGIPKPGSVNISLEPGDINVTPPDVSLTVEPSRSSKMSKFGIKVLPDFKFKGSAKSPDLGMTQLPTGLDVREAELSIPKVEIHTPKASELAVDIDMPDGSKMKSPKGNVSMAIDMPEQEFSEAMPNVPSDVKLNIEAPSLNVSAPAGVAEMNLKGPAISQPKMDVTLPTSANLGLDLKSPSLPDVEVDHEIPNEVSIDLNKTAKSGFHIKFPKFGGNKSAKAEIAETAVEITAPEIDAALPEASLEVDPKLKKDGSKAGFEFKMPKLSLKKKPELAMEVKTSSSVQAQIPGIDVDVKMPGASVDIQPPTMSVSALEVELPSASIDVKKPKIGFSMPKFNMGKDNVELKDSLDVDVGIPSAHIDISRKSDDSDSDDDSEEGKKKLKFGKVPKISINKPHIQMEASVPDASAKVEIPSAQVDGGDLEKMDVKTKNKFGFKIPKFGAGANISGGDLDLDASRELKLPSAEVKVETSDSSDDDEDENGDKKKKRFNIKMQKFGLPKAEVDVNSPSIDLPAITSDIPNIKPIEGNLEIGVPNLTGDVLRMQSDSEDSDSKDEGKKKSKSLKINAPELQLGGGINSPSLALSPIAFGDMSTTGGADVAFDVKAPSLSFSTPVSSSELKIKGPRNDQPNIDVTLPKTANLDLKLKSPSLPDVPACPDVSNPEVSVDLNKASKSGFHIKFPKFGGSKTVKVDVPDTGVKIGAPEIDVALPEASLEVDPKLKKDGSKAGFEFKMPKLSLKKKPELAVEVKTPSLQAQIPEVDVDVKMPRASVDIQPPAMSVSAPVVELPPVTVDVKKSKHGFSMPKFNMGKGHVELKDSSNIVVDVPNLKADLPHLTALSDSEESEGGKKKHKFGKMPKMSINKPHIQVEASLPDASVEVPNVDVGDSEKADVKMKNKFGFKIPKFGASANISGGDLDVDASRELEVKSPSAEVKVETSDSSDDDEGENGEKKKKRFNIKMPKFGLPKAEVDVNSSNIGVPAITADLPNIKTSDGTLDIETPKFDATFPKISSKMDHSDSDDESKKISKNTMGLAIEGAVPDVDANVTINTGNLDFSLAEKKKKGSEFGIKFPKVKKNLKGNQDSHSDSDTSSDEDAEKDKAFGGKIAIPSVDLFKPKAELQGSIKFPNAEFDVKQPKLDLETEIGDDENDDDDAKKKSSKFGFSIKMPKFNMKKKTLNADIEDKDISGQLNLDSTSGGTEDDRSSEDKKKGKVSVKLPKFSMKKPDFDADLGVDKNIDVQADVKMPKGNLPEIAIHGDKEMANFSLPEVSIEKPKLDLHLDSNIEVDGSKKFSIDSGKVNFGQLPVGITVGGQVQPPRVPDGSLNIATGTNLQADVGFPGVELEVDHDDLDDEKKKSKFFKMPKFHMGKHHSEFKVDHGAKLNLPEKIDAELNLSPGKVELDQNISVDISNKDEGDSDDDKKDSGKKKTRFGIKMPKFQMKQSHAPGMNVDIKPEDVAFGVKIPTLEANVEPLFLEQDSISSDNTSIEMDLPKLPDVNPIEVDLTVPNVKVEVPEKEGKKKGKFSFKSNFKMPKLHMSSHGKGNAELEVPSTEISLPKLEIDSAAEIRKSEIDCGDIETEALDVKFGASLPKMDKPSTDFDIKFDSNVSYPNLSLDVKGDVKPDESDEEKNKGEKKKSVGLGFKMPKLSASPKTEFKLPEVKAEVNVKAPKTETLKLEGNFDLGESDQYKKSPFIVKMPALNPVKPDIQLNVPAPKHDSHSDDSDSEEEKNKKGFKLGFKLPQLSMPQLSMSAKSEGIHADSTLNVTKPELGVTSIDTNVSLPEVNISTKEEGRFETDFNMPSFSADKRTTDDSSDSEDEKSKKEFKLGFKMPKLFMGGKSDLDADAAIKTKQPELDVPSVDAEISLPEVDITTKKKGSFGSHFKMPTFSTKAEISANAEQFDKSDDSSDSEDEKSKKGLKFGFKMPKLSMGGNSNDSHLDVDAAIKMKQQPELNVPSVEAEVSLPEVDLTTKKKGSFGSHFKMPTFSTKADVASGEQIDTSDDDSDSDDEKSKKGLKLGFKMPKFSMGGKGEANLDADAAIKMKQPELDVPSVDADISLPEVDLTTKKEGSFGSHFKMPSFSTKADISASAEKVDKSDDSSDSEDETSKKGLNIGFKMPKLLMGAKSDANLDANAAIKIKQPELDVPSIDAGVSLPEVDITTKKKGSFGSHFKMPTFSTKADVTAGSGEQIDSSDDSSDSEDEKTKKGLKLGFKMPKLSVSGKSDDSSMDSDAVIKMKQPEINVPSVDAEVSLPEVDITTKKKGSFGSHFKMPNFSTKANVSASGTEQIDSSDDDSESEDDKSKKGLKLGFKMPKLSMGGKSDVDLATDAAIKMKQPELDVPSVDAEISIPEVDITTKKKGSFGSHFKMPTFSTKADVIASSGEQIDTSDDSCDSEDDKSKKGLKLGFKMPKLSMGGKSDIDLDADAAIKTKQPKLDVASVGAEISLPEVDITTKKKGSFGSHFKMPTFSTKADVSAGSGEQIDTSDDDSDSDDEKSKKGLKLGFKMPQLSKSGKNDVSLDSDYTVKVKQPDLDIPSIDAEVSLPEAELSTKKKSSFGSHFKMPSFSTKANVSASGAEQVDTSDDSSDTEDEKSKKGLKLGFKMPHISTSAKGDVSLDSDSTFKVTQPALDVPSIDAELSLPEAELSTKKKSSFGSHFKMPTFSTKASVSASQVDRNDDSSDSEDDKSKKGLKLGFKMPQISTGGNLDSDSTIKIKQPELDVPSIDAVPLPEVEVSTKKKSSFGSHFKMPSFSTKANVGVSGAAKIDTSDDSSDSEDENSKKGLKMGVKMPQISTGVKGGVNLDSDSTIKLKQPELDLPSIDAGISLPDADLTIKKKSSFGSHFKMPSFSTKSNVTVSGVEVPEVNMVSLRLQTQEEEHGFSVAGEEDSEKKSHKIGIKLPKFQTRQRNAEVTLPQVELKTEHSSDEEDNDKELKIKVKKPKFGIKLPEFNKPKPDAGINIQHANLTGNIGSDVDFPRTSIEINQPSAISLVDTSNIDIQVGNIDDEVAKVNAQIAQVQAEIDIQSGKQKAKIESDESSSSSSDSETEKRTKMSGINFGLKLPKFSLGKEKPEMEPKVDVSMPSVSLTTKNNGDDMTSPSLSSLEVEPVKLEGGHGSEKEKKKFSLGLKMPKFPSKGSAVVVEGDVGSSSKDVDAAAKPLKVSVKAPKMKLKKKKGEHHQSSSSDSDSDENNGEEDQTRNKDASGNTQLMGLEVKLPRVQVYKNVEYQEAEKGHHDSSSDEEDEVKDIKKNIGARFGVKLKKPKMFSSSKVEITGKNDSGNNSSSLQPEWKLPRVDLRRASKSSDQELSIEVDLDGISEQQKLEQLSPSERADAIRRDSKSSAGIRLHSPSYVNLMPSPRSKKPTLEMLDVDSSPKLLSVTRLNPTPPIESSVKMQQPMYGNIELTTTISGPQVSASQVPSSVIMASDAVKMKRGPPTPARRFIVPFEPNSAALRVAPPVITTDVTVEGGFSTMISEDVSSELEVNIGDPSFASSNNQQASDTDISITTSTGSDTLVISCPTPSSGQQEAHNRKASSLGDLTRIPTSGSEEGSLERTVSLDFKPVSTLAGNSSRAIYNLAVQDLSRVGEDSDEDYNLNRKRTISDHASLESEVTVVTADEVDAQRLSSADMSGSNRTFLTINTDVEGGNVTQRPLGSDIAESLWFGSTSIQTVESVQTTMSYTQMEESISTDVTLTTTSLGTSPSETSSSSEGSPFSPASPEPSGESTPNLIEHSSQIENGRNQQFHTEMTELAQGELGFSETHTITLEMSSLSEDSQPQPLTDLNPSAGNFAAVRNRFEQLSGSNPLNGGETTGSLGRNSGRMSQTQGTVIKRLSGNFEDLPPSSVNVVQKSFMQHIAPELSEGALSRTVIISSLTLDRAEQNSVSSTTGIGPESPVPNLEPPC